MKKLFIESSEFTAWIRRFLHDDAYAAFQQKLMDNPELGAVIPGCSGLRKARISDARRQRGKRGGARVVYLHVPEVDWVFLLDIYGKNEKDDLSVHEKKVLRRLAEEFKRSAIRPAKREG